MAITKQYTSNMPVAIVNNDMASDAIAASMALRWMLKYLLFFSIGFRYHGTIATDFIDFERCEAMLVDDLFAFRMELAL